MRATGEAARFAARLVASCGFAAAFFAVLLASHHVTVPGLSRYDSIFVACVVLQLALLATRFETLDEAKVLVLFHALGLGLELWKTDPRVASWSYPEAARFTLGQVPLYSGFMYAAVASFICQAWRRCAVELHDPPPPAVAMALVAAIYLNFFTHHLTWDLRWPLTAAVLVAFRTTSVTFSTAPGVRRRLPLVVWFALVGAGIWLAENAATAGGAWAYPDQRLGWRAVSLGKVQSWSLLVIVSFVLVAELKRRKAELSGSRTFSPGGRTRAGRRRAAGRRRRGPACGRRRRART